MIKQKDYSAYHFEGQAPEEKILLVLHRYWFDIVSQFFLIFFMLVIFTASFSIFSMNFPQLSQGIWKELFFFLDSLYLMIIWIVAYAIWIDYYFDVWIVTDRRIVNIEQKGLFARVVSELELEKIQDITTNIQGIIKTFLNYGDMQVQTAAEQEKFLFHNIARPEEVKDLIMTLQKKYVAEHEREFGELLRKKVHHKPR